ncbi:MAG: redox-sensing transcriptional repressor Rex [Lachnospiraceae bacterium]|nr:redox-sensing transcriptional repressor Rex [Lachnospiraceae bacterium]
MSDKPISQLVIKRLPIYYRYLGELSEKGIERISSKELAQRMGGTASQIRQDLNNFGEFGQQGYGYNVDYLRSEIGKILGIDREQTIIIIGTGNLGQALANYDFGSVGFKLIGLFDVNPRLYNLVINGVEILPVDSLPEFIAANKVDVATLAVPRSRAKEMAKELEDLGIRAIWNFALTELDVSDRVSVSNMHLDDGLMTLSYNYRQNQDK